MNKLLVVFTIGAVIAQLMPAAPLAPSDDTRFYPFIKRGRLVSFYGQDINQPSDAHVCVYEPFGRTAIPLTGNPAGLQQMLRNEFSQGVPESFVRENLVQLLASCLGGDRTQGLLQEPLITKLRSPEATGHVEYLPFIRPPVSHCKGNGWAVKFVTLGGDGVLSAHVYKGELRPFSIRIAAEFVLSGAFSDFNEAAAKTNSSHADELFNQD